MALNLKSMESKGGIQLPRVEDGTYVALVTGITHLGYQLQTDYATQEVQKDKFGNDKYSDRVNFSFVIPSESITIDLEEADEDGNTQRTYQRYVYKEFAASMMAQSGLAKMLKAVDPKGEIEDLAELLGRPVMVTIGSTSGGNAKVTAVAAMMKGMEAPEMPENVNVRSFDMDESEAEVFNALPEYFQNLIRESRDWDKSAIAKKVEAAETSGSKEADDATADMLG